MKTNKKKINVLKIIHGYPPYYMAGSEVYTYNLCNELSKHVDVSIFTRIEDEFKEIYEIDESNENKIKILRVNKPFIDYTFRSKYIDRKLAEIFEEYLLKINPDIVHIGHLSHLTLLIVDIIKKKDIPILFTLHDYWMMCIRGQLIKKNLVLCDGPSLKKCTDCSAKYFESKFKAKKEVKFCLDVLEKTNSKIDLFIAPSKFLRQKYIDYGVPEHKIIYMDYGFDLSLFKNIEKKPSKLIRFGFLGRIIPVKGIAALIDCFNEIDHTKAELNIYGDHSISQQYLVDRCKNSSIHFKGPYNYKDIGKVFSDIDVLIVPSVWYENSPLVIHEGFLANVPIITSNLGGMAELVQNHKNGLLFEPGNVDDLRKKVNQFINNPSIIKKFTEKPTPVRSIQEDAQEIMSLYNRLLNNKGA
ncbi:MAG: glycosyltransferase family 4 protein [Promethearchaeota archaeon]